MQTPDVPQDKWRQLGERVARDKPAPKSGDVPVPGAPSGIVVGPDGKMRTTTHMPENP